MKCYAVLYNHDLGSARRWLRSTVLHGGAGFEDTGPRSITAADRSSAYVFISTVEQARGMEFAGYVKSPDYETLEDAVRQAVRL